jgi:hypothetical protein
MSRNVDPQEFQTYSEVSNIIRPIIFLMILFSGFSLMGCGVYMPKPTSAARWD